MSRRPAWLALLLSVCVTVAAAAGPAPAEPGVRPPPGSDEDELWYAMDQAERELRQHPLRLHDEALNAYVRGVACKVAADYCADLRVYVIEQPWFNASMAPNGMMMVWTGALLRFQDESELALVLGHEFAHFRQRHSLQQWRRTKRTTAFLNSFGLVAWAGGAGAAGQVAGLLGAASLYQHSRDAEREADRAGFAAAVAQGYDPMAGARLWQRMKAEEDARRYGKPIPVFATHPRTAERLADVRAAGLAAAPDGWTGDPGRESYLAAVRPHLMDWLEDELGRRMYDSSVQVIGDLHALAPPELQALYGFYLAEALRRRNEPGDQARAEALYEAVLGQPDPPAGAWREWGLVLRGRGNRVAAAEALRRYLALAPEADDAAFIRHYLTELEARP
ncbi:M48 family metallopeptidase [Arenimonas fontis]|uniref:M48 family metalloprotease n=1 Tax=Arenimonas fontis TaxID=2608255 RepID=A0A5B2ZGV8_9GAMM|nr:M48 family metallopeptidase [Arenimonas fontis]KAA2286311.1 M48 family metalloprotease [Arenimonas fontis]